MEPKLRVLIAEDELIIALLIEQMVERMGHTVIEKVVTGEEAIKVAQRLKPDLILMDICLKGELNGIETIQLIRDEEMIPVIFITGNSDEKNRKRVSNLDSLAFLVKPITYQDLSRSLSLAS